MSPFLISTFATLLSLTSASTPRVQVASRQDTADYLRRNYEQQFNEHTGRLHRIYLGFIVKLLVKDLCQIESFRRRFRKATLHMYEEIFDEMLKPTQLFRLSGSRSLQLLSVSDCRPFKTSPPQVFHKPVPIPSEMDWFAQVAMRLPASDTGPPVAKYSMLVGTFNIEVTRHINARFLRKAKHRRSKVYPHEPKHFKLQPNFTEWLQTAEECTTALDAILWLTLVPKVGKAYDRGKSAVAEMMTKLRNQARDKFKLTDTQLAGLIHSCFTWQPESHYMPLNAQHWAQFLVYLEVVDDLTNQTQIFSRSFRFTKKEAERALPFDTRLEIFYPKYVNQKDVIWQFNSAYTEWWMQLPRSNLLLTSELFKLKLQTMLILILKPLFAKGNLWGDKRMRDVVANWSGRPTNNKRATFIRQNSVNSIIATVLAVALVLYFSPVYTFRRALKQSEVLSTRSMATTSSAYTFSLTSTLILSTIGLITFGALLLGLCYFTRQSVKSSRTKSKRARATWSQYNK